MEMQRVIKMLAEIQEKAETDRKEMLVEMKAKADIVREERKANQEQMLAKIEANTEAIRENIKSGQSEMRSIVGAIKEKMDAWIANTRDSRKERMSCQETMEACLECDEPTSVVMESEANRWEVSKEHAAVETDKVLRKQHRGRTLAAG
jgi:hypothetical protein